MRIAVRSCESAELKPDHGDKDPSLGAFGGGLGVANQSAAAHEPSEGSFHNPAARQHLKTFGGIRALDHLHLEFGADGPDPLGECFAGKAGIHPKDAQPGKETQHSPEQALRALALRSAGRGDHDAQDQAERSTRRKRLRPLICLPAS